MIYTASTEDGQVRMTESVAEARRFIMEESKNISDDILYGITDSKGRYVGSVMHHATSYYWKDTEGLYRLLESDGMFNKDFVPTDLPPGEIPSFVVCDNPFRTIEAARRYIQNEIVPSVGTRDAQTSDITDIDGNFVEEHFIDCDKVQFITFMEDIYTPGAYNNRLWYKANADGQPTAKVHTDREIDRRCRT